MPPDTPLRYACDSSGLPPPPRPSCQYPPPPSRRPPPQVLTDSGGGCRIRTSCSRPPGAVPPAILLQEEVRLSVNSDVVQAHLAKPVTPVKLMGLFKSAIVSQEPWPAHRSKILIVDDLAINRRLMRTHLDSWGFANIDEAEDGQGALRAAQQCSAYSAILMDINMPVMDGCTAAVHIRKMPLYNSIAIFAVTANVSADLQQQCIESGMNAVFAKPINFPDLRAALQQAMAGQRTPASERRSTGGRLPGMASVSSESEIQ